MPDTDLTSLLKILPEYTRQGRTALLPALHAAQALYGYLPEPVAVEIGRALNIPLADVFGVIEFYHLLTTEPAPDKTIHVCGDPACALAGAGRVLEGLEGLGVSPRKVKVGRTGCLGLCDQAPAIMIDLEEGPKQRAVVYADRIRPVDILVGAGEAPSLKVGGDVSILTSNCHRGHPTGLGEYRESGGYQALEKALGLPPESVIAEVKTAGLVGRGGAAFPTGLKWEGAARAHGDEKYVICNADEAEPGTFKDRVLMEGDPHRILEGLIIAAYAIGAHKGYIYIRGEYYSPFQAMDRALVEARQAGLIGKNILDSSFDFEIELRRGAGAYVCGEETALFESIEGKRGFPRLKPPFPTTSGLFGKPTVINNVETLANIPTIIREGAQAYRSLGTEKSPGSKLFCLSGDVARPGLYEAPFGITLRHLVFDLAGGMRSDASLQAMLIGGAAGAFALSQDLEVKLSFEDLRTAGLPLGSGVVTVFDSSRNMREVFLELGQFFAEESCGKCYPCQLGTQRQVEILARLAAGKPLPGDAERLADVGATMTDASLCGLGQTAATAVLSALRLWPILFT